MFAHTDYTVTRRRWFQLNLGNPYWMTHVSQGYEYLTNKLGSATLAQVHKEQRDHLKGSLRQINHNRQPLQRVRSANRYQKSISYEEKINKNILKTHLSCHIIYDLSAAAQGTQCPITRLQPRRHLWLYSRVISIGNGSTDWLGFFLVRQTCLGV